MLRFAASTRWVSVARSPSGCEKPTRGALVGSRGPAEAKKTPPKPVQRPLQGRRFAQLLLRIHGRDRALQIANEISATRAEAGDAHSAKVWKGIAADVKRAPAGNRRLIDPATSSTD